MRKVDDEIKKGTLFVFVCWLVYTMAQLGRYSYNYNITLIMERFSIDHATAAIPTTLFFFSYGFGQILFGFLCSRYNRRLVLTGVLLMTVAINLAIFFGIDFKYYKYLWALNGISQANLWPSLMLALKQNIKENFLPKVAIIMSIASTGGRFASAGLCGLFAINKDYFMYSFLVASIIIILVAFIWFFAAKGTDRPVVIDPIKKGDQVQSKVDAKTILVLVVFGMVSFVSYAVSGGLQSWIPDILKSSYGLQDWLAIFMSVVLPLFVLSSSFIATFLYRKLKDFVLSCLIMLFVGGILMMGVQIVLPIHWVPIMILFTIECISMSIISNQTTVQVPLLFKGKVNSGVLAGILNGCCYMGTALSNYALGKITDKNGSWNGSFSILTILLFSVGVITLIYFILTKIKGGRKAVKESASEEETDLTKETGSVEEAE